MPSGTVWRVLGGVAGAGVVGGAVGLCGFALILLIDKSAKTLVTQNRTTPIRAVLRQN